MALVSSGSPHRDNAPAPPPIITLTTDFGDQDWYVATLKGVIFSINPYARLVDNTHRIRPGDVQSTAYILKQLVIGFPPGTIHLAVVDPGVGSSRRPIIASSREQLFVGPDNGIFDLVLADSSDVQLVEINQSPYTRDNPSCTFHGRDIFAPVAAHASLGIGLNDFGIRRAFEPVKTVTSVVSEKHQSLEGTIVYIDHYGNAISNIPRPSDWSPERYQSVQLPNQRKTIPTGDYYAVVPPGELLAIVGSGGHLEVSVNQGNAATDLDLRVGDPIILQLEKS